MKYCGLTRHHIFHLVVFCVKYFDIYFSCDELHVLVSQPSIIDIKVRYIFGYWFDDVKRVYDMTEGSGTLCSRYLVCECQFSNVRN